MTPLRSLLNPIQAAVSQAVYTELARELPLTIETVVIIARLYGVEASFHVKGERIAGGCNVNLNRWTCRTDGTNVTSISVG